MTDENKMMAVHGYMTKAKELAEMTFRGQPTTEAGARNALIIARYCVRAAQLAATLDREEHHADVEALYVLLGQVRDDLTVRPDRVGA